MARLLFPLIAIITNLPVLGWAKPVPVNITRLRGHWKRKYMLIAAAGPASNLVLAIRVASPARHSGAGPPAEAALGAAGRGFRTGGLLNVLLAVFNMVPVPPLDGGNVLAGVLRGPVADMYDRLRPVRLHHSLRLDVHGILTMIIPPPANFLLDWLL